MKRLLHFEFYMLRRSKTLLICLIVTVALVLLKAASVAGMMALDAKYGGSELTSVLLAGLDGWHFMGGLRSSLFDGISLLNVTSVGTIENAELMLLTVVFVTIFTCSDRSSNTLKNVCARGYGRTQVFFGKYVAAAVGAALLFLTAAVASLAFGGLFWGFGPENDCLLAALLQLYVFLCYFTFCFAIAMMVFHVALSLVSLLIGARVLSVLLLLLDVLIFKESSPLSDHWFDAFFKTAQTPGASGEAVLTAVLFSTLYAGLALGGSWLINRRRQI